MVLGAYSVDPSEALPLQILPDATLRPDGAALLQVALLPGDVTGGRDVPAASCLGQVWFDEDLVVEQLGGALPLQLQTRQQSWR